ncbi:MAG: hypothetical protein WHT45_08465 [Ignavibacterium sp.]
MKNVNKFFFVLLVLALSTLIETTYSQSIYFCEGVDDDGEPINESSVFTIPNNGGYLYVLIQLPYAVNCRKVDLVIYRNGAYDNTIRIDTQKNWTWFWEKVTFYDDGDYDVYVYDCNNYLLTDGSLEIEFD